MGVRPTELFGPTRQTSYKADIGVVTYHGCGCFERLFQRGQAHFHRRHCARRRFRRLSAFIQLVDIVLDIREVRGVRSSVLFHRCLQV